MPDDWERAHGLNPDDPRDGNADRDHDGYTNARGVAELPGSTGDGALIGRVGPEAATVVTQRRNAASSP